MEVEPIGRFEITDLDKPARQVLVDLLGSYDIDAKVEGDELLAPAAESELIEDLIEHARPPDDSRAPDPRGRSGEANELVLDGIAPRWKRFAGFTMQGYTFMGIALFAYFLSEPLGLIVGWALTATGVVLVALIGKTVGMWMFSIHIVHLHDGSSPTLKTAVIRWAVVNWTLLPSTLADASGWTPALVVALVINLLWPIACFGTILIDPLGQGLHDRAASTLVVVDGYLPPDGVWPFA